jgi:hypothetical protein
MEKIDAVITWVDGSDHKYQLKHHGFLKQRGDFKKQYLQADEIDFCVLSIIKYAPFIRKIFIVTDGQAPDLIETKKLATLDKIKIVDHKEVFSGLEDFLPTFNIRSIDAVLYKIKGLSEKFIYFNDDMFLIKESRPDDWFVDDKAVLIGSWAKTYNIQPLKKITQLFKSALKRRPSYNGAQSKAANIAGFNKKYFKSYHSGRPQMKSVIKNFYENNPEILKRQLSYKFRNDNQYMPYSLCWHLLIKQGRYESADKNRLIEIEKTRNLGPEKLKRILLDLDRNITVRFLNIQDLNFASKETVKVFKDWLRNKLAELN